jgi:spermidine synthase
MSARVAGLFFFSGISGLIFQVVWFRRLALIFGVTSYALGVVLAAFMAGLAIGSVAGGRLADRRAVPLRVYGFIELAIAVCGLSVLPLLNLVQDLYVSLAPQILDRPVALSAMRFVLSFMAMIPATACMGATLPVGVAAIDTRDSRGVSRLYAANTAGAVVGVLAGGFVLLGVLGLTRSSIAAAALNLACAAGALWLAHGVCALRPPRTMSRPAAPSTRAPLSAVQRTVLALLFLGGLAALAYEVIWTRLFSVLAFEVAYGYALMLAVLLAGVASGSALYGRWTAERPGRVAKPIGSVAQPTGPRDPVTHLIWIECGIGSITALSLLILKPLASDGLASSALSWPGIGELVRRCAGCVSMLPGLLTIVFATSALSGAAIPAAARVFAGSGEGWGTRLGMSYASNVVGAVFGSLLAGFWLVPAYGAHASLLIVALVNVLVAAALAMVARQRALAGGVAAAGLIALAPAYLGIDRLDVYRTALAARLSNARILWYDEGLESSVAVAENNADRFLLINGAIHSASTGLYYHRWLGHLGAIAHPAPRSALVIGLGGGATAGAMALHPDLSVHVVELSDGVIAAADAVLTDDNYRLFEKPHVTREVDDGRNHLLVSGRRYDIIEADIVEPRHAGASVLYSYEYFESARRALNDGGIMVQWLGSPGSDAYQWTLTTFRRVFPHVTLWIGRGDVGVGSMTPQSPPDRARLERLFANPTLAHALRDANIENADQILALRASDERRTPVAPILTDDRPVLEYFLTLPFVTRRAFGLPGGPGTFR